MKTFKEVRHQQQLDEGKKFHALVAGAMLALSAHHAHAQEALKQVQDAHQEAIQSLPAHKVPHDSVEDAALAGMHECKTTQPEKHECGFAIYQHKGKFFHSEVQTSGKDGSIDGMKIKMPKEATLLGIGHTHPSEPRAGGDDTSHWFSKEDVAYAKKTGLHMYMGSQKSGKVTVYKHGKTKIENHSQLGKISFGDPVGDYK